MKNKLTPQAKQVLEHLLAEGTLTGAEAATVYKIRHLPRRIADLREAGWPIARELRKDRAGQRYARYFLAEGRDVDAA